MAELLIVIVFLLSFGDGLDSIRCFTTQKLSCSKDQMKRCQLNDHLFGNRPTNEGCYGKTDADDEVVAECDDAGSIIAGLLLV